MAGMNPERKSHHAIEEANRKMLDEQDKRLEKWREERLSSIERDREVSASNSDSQVYMG